MKADIHPQTYEATISCACGAQHVILSTQETFRVEVCASCHPFFTGQQRFVDAEGRIDKFKNKFGSALDAMKNRTKAKKKKKGDLTPEGKPLNVTAEEAPAG